MNDSASLAALTTIALTAIGLFMGCGPDASRRVSRVPGGTEARCDTDDFVRAHECVMCPDGPRVDTTEESPQSDACSDAFGVTCDVFNEAYIKASNAERNDHFGKSVALSSDGSTLAIGAPNEASTADGVCADQTNNAAPGSGAVYIFRRRDSRWTQEAYIKASNADTGDGFGDRLALSQDGSTLAVGAFGERGVATGVCGDHRRNGREESGAVYVFQRTEQAWAQQAYLKASNSDELELFGSSVALSSDGSTLAVGARTEDSSATGVGGDQADNATARSGAVYVFQRRNATWRQQAYVKASNTGRHDQFGSSVALSADGATLAVGAPGEASSATGVAGDQSNDDAAESGAVYVFRWFGSMWTQEAYLKASNTQAAAKFGGSVALSADGLTLAVGAHHESRAGTGIDSVSTGEALESGAAYVFRRGALAWTQEAYLKASNPDPDDWFGVSVTLSADGSTLAVGAPREDGSGTGLGGDPADNETYSNGAAYVFARTGSTWSQRAYVKPSNSGANFWFGQSVSVSSDGSAMAVGAHRETGAATCIGGDQTSNRASDSGAVYVRRLR